MKKRISIYLISACLILIGVRAQQIDVGPITLQFESGPPLALMTDDSPIDYGIMPWPPNGSWGTMALRLLTCDAGMGTALIQVAIAPELIDLNGLAPNESVLDTYFQFGIVDGVGNNPADLFVSSLNNSWLNPAIPLQSAVFAGAQSGDWGVSYAHLVPTAGAWQTSITISIIAQ